ncbi:hypothetical protein AB4383_16770 [Vibrio breoganii]
MKKLLMVALVAIGVVGCSSTPETVKVDCAFPDKSDAPNWYCDKQVPTDQPYRFYISSSDAKTGYSTQERLAISNATVKLSQELDSNIASLVSEKERLTTNSGITLSKKLTEISSTLVSDTKISGVRHYETAEDASGHLWVLVGISELDYLETKQQLLARSIQTLEQEPLSAPEKEELVSLKSLLN